MCTSQPFVAGWRGLHDRQQPLVAIHPLSSRQLPQAHETPPADQSLAAQNQFTLTSHPSCIKGGELLQNFIHIFTHDLNTVIILLSIKNNYHDISP